jgi:hypothetical protein
MSSTSAELARIQAVFADVRAESPMGSAAKPIKCTLILLLGMDGTAGSLAMACFTAAGAAFHRRDVSGRSVSGA